MKDFADTGAVDGRVAAAVVLIGRLQPSRIIMTVRNNVDVQLGRAELLENINEVEAGIRKGREEDPDNQELGELVQRMGELGAGIIR